MARKEGFPVANDVPGQGREPVLVTGSTGVLGRLVVARLASRGIPVHAGFHRRIPAATDGVLPVHVDVSDASRLAAAVSDAAAVIHCATHRRQHRGVDRSAAVALAGAAGDTHVIFPGVVGSDLVPLGYHRSKTLAEESVMRASAWTTVRATDFHQRIWDLLTVLARAPVVVVPNDTRFQVLDPAVLAIRLVDAVDNGPAGRLPDIGGPFAYEARELARSYLRASRRRRLVARWNLPGITGAALRAGANLTANRDGTGEQWNDFVDRRMGEP